MKNNEIYIKRINKLINSMKSCLDDEPENYFRSDIINWITELTDIYKCIDKLEDRK